MHRHATKHHSAADAVVAAAAPCAHDAQQSQSHYFGRAVRRPLQLPRHDAAQLAAAPDDANE